MFSARLDLSNEFVTQLGEFDRLLHLEDKPHSISIHKCFQRQRRGPGAWAHLLIVVVLQGLTLELLPAQLGL